MSGRIPREFIDQVLQRIDIVDVINQRVPLKKAGKDYQACCPFHHEKTPSFTVSQDKQFYHCFGCGAHGSALSFLIDYDRMPFVEAVESLARNAGMEMPQEVLGQIPAQDLRPLYGLLSKAADYYASQLRRNPAAPKAVEYLKGRGLDGVVAARFALGYAPSGWSGLLEEMNGRQGIAISQLQEAGLVVTGDQGRSYDRFRDRIIFPIRDIRGRVVGFGGRVLDDEKPKYLNSPETPVFHKGRQLYGLYEMRLALRRPDRLLVVEGYMDVVALSQQGIHYAVATLGTATTADHLELLFRQAAELVFCFDGDRAGQEAAWKALTVVLPMLTQGREVRFLFLPEGEDPDSLIRKEGADQFSERVTRAMPLSDYLLGHLAQGLDLTSLDGRARYAEHVRPYVDQLPDGLFKTMLRRRLAQQAGLESRDLASEKQRAQAVNEGVRQPKRLHKGPRGKVRVTPVRQAITLLLKSPALALLDGLAEQWQACELDGVLLLREMMELIQRNPAIQTGHLVEHWRDTEYFSHLQSLSVAGLAMQEEGYEAEFRDCLQRLQQEAYQQELMRLTARSEAGELSEEERDRVKTLMKLIAQ